MNWKVKIAFSLSVLCIFCMVCFFSTAVFAQRIDTSRLSIKPKPIVVNKNPQIKSNIQPYKPSVLMDYGSNSTVTPVKSGKALSILKVYPNPVSDQININIRVEKETNFSVKITDILGNVVATLANEKNIAAGEQTKTYYLPRKLNPGIYHLQIVSSSGLNTKRISVL